MISLWMRQQRLQQPPHLISDDALLTLAHAEEAQMVIYKACAAAAWDKPSRAWLSLHRTYLASFTQSSSSSSRNLKQEQAGHQTLLEDI